MGVKKNFLYNSILTISNYIFPLITYPYISRVLGVTNIGICNFVDSIVNYFLLFSMMGMASIGIREIAATLDDANNRSKVFSNLITFNALTTLFSALIYILCIFLVPGLSEYRHLLYIGLVKIIANFFLINWLFVGLEDFKYITVRSILVHLLYVIAVYIFIKNSDDYHIYYLMTTVSIVVNAIINCSYSRKFVKFRWGNFDLKPIFKSSMILGFRNILTSMYTTFNVLFLGFVTCDTEVGYYTTATKLYGIIMALFSAFTSVMMPRMSSLISEGKMDKFKSMIIKSIDVLLIISIPLIIYTIIYAPDIILLLSGQGYEGAIKPMQLVMPLVLIIGLEQILITQTLVPLKADKAVLANTIFGAIVGLSFNFLLVHHLKSIGSSIVWIFSEFAVLSSALYFVKTKIGVSLPWGKIIKNIFSYIPFTFILVVLTSLDINYVVKLIISGIITLLYAIVMNLFIIKNEIVLSIVDKIIIKKRND